jgi:hypothetical protein
MSAEATASRIAGTAAHELEDRLVWIFGPARGGGARLLRALKRPDIVAVNDLGLGTHLAPVAWIPDGEYFAHNRNAEHQYYFFAERYMSELAPELAELVLRQLSRQVRALGGGGARWVMVNEPEGHVADSILRLLPRSRTILVLRDGRQVIAEGARHAADRPPAKRSALLQRLATQWVQRTAALQRTLAAADEAQRLLVRYEDFAADPNNVCRAVWAWLGIEPVADDGASSGPAEASIPDWSGQLDEGAGEPLLRIMGAKLREVGYGD